MSERNLKACAGCVDPARCCNEAICHYTGSPMLEPDGSVRANWRAGSDNYATACVSTRERIRETVKRIGNKLKACQGCLEPDNCTNQAICHYTGSPMREPDGSVRAEWSTG